MLIFNFDVLADQRGAPDSLLGLGWNLRFGRLNNSSLLFRSDLLVGFRLQLLHDLINNVRIRFAGDECLTDGAQLLSVQFFDRQAQDLLGVHAADAFIII